MSSMDGKTALRVLLVGVALGLFVGVSAVFGWAHETPAALGFFTFAGVIIGAEAGRRGKS